MEPNHRKCSGLTKQGKPCEAPVVAVRSGQDIVYGDFCHHHGGFRQKHKLVTRLQEQKLAQAIKRFGAPIEVNPADALLQLVWETAGNVAWLRERVRELNILGPGLSDESQDPDGNGISHRRHRDFLSFDHLGNLTPHALVRMYNDERDRLTRVCKVAVECGLAERQMRLAERYAQVIVQVIMHVLEAPQLDLTPHQREIGRQLAATKMRELNASVEKTVSSVSE